MIIRQEMELQKQEIGLKELQRTGSRVTKDRE